MAKTFRYPAVASPTTARKVASGECASLDVENRAAAVLLALQGRLGVPFPQGSEADVVAVLGKRHGITGTHKQMVVCEAGRTLRVECQQLTIGQGNILIASWFDVLATQIGKAFFDSAPSKVPTVHLCPMMTPGADGPVVSRIKGAPTVVSQVWQFDSSYRLSGNASKTPNANPVFVNVVALQYA